MAQRVVQTVDELVAVYAKRVARQTPASQELHREAREVLCGGVSSHFKAWHPFYVQEARGSRLIDLDGNEYVDLVMGFGPNVLGHSPEVVVEAVREVIGRGTSLAIATALEVELAQAIARHVPSLERMRFVATGTEATMMALRTARAFTRRAKIGRFEGHYHGQHDAALVSIAHVAGPPEAPEPVPDGAGIPPGVLAETVVFPWNDAAGVERLFHAHGADLAALILEPIPFSNIGGNEPERGLLLLLRDLTREAGVLLVFDEVITGFRLSLGGAAAYFGIAPDLHTFGKTAGGGLPIGVYGGRRDVMDAVVTPKGGDPHGAETIFQSGTFSGIPPAMAAGLAMIQELERTDALEVAAGRAEAIRAGWQELARGFRLAVQVTGTSSWLGLSFTNTPIGSVRDTLTADRRYQLAFSLGLLANGVYIAPSHPGFTSAAHSESDVEYVLEASERVLADLAAAR